MNRSNCLKAILIGVPVFLLGVFSFIYYLFFAIPFTTGGNAYLYIDKDDTVDSVYCKLEIAGKPSQLIGIRLLWWMAGPDRVNTGRYLVNESLSSIQLFRNLRNGAQQPVNLTIQAVRTKDRLGRSLSSKLMLDSASVVEALRDENTCVSYGFDTITVMCMFIPNTYEVYWDVSLDDFLKRMHKEYLKFWSDGRMEQAKQIGLTPIEVATLASIIDEETANNAEKPRIAGMYINRLKKGMPLQADPTIKFALQQFELRRIYHKLLNVDSPYNTYRNVGLPPGPIRIPSIAAIDAVLAYEKHDYLYMCAKEDFSGTHNFASTYSEHLRNARKYTEALNNRNIK